MSASDQPLVFEQTEYDRQRIAETAGADKGSLRAAIAKNLFVYTGITVNQRPTLRQAAFMAAKLNSVWLGLTAFAIYLTDGFPATFIPLGPLMLKALREHVAYPMWNRVNKRREAGEPKDFAEALDRRILQTGAKGIVAGFLIWSVPVILFTGNSIRNSYQAQVIAAHTALLEGAIPEARDYIARHWDAEALRAEIKDQKHTAFVNGKTLFQISAAAHASSFPFHTSQETIINCIAFVLPLPEDSGAMRSARTGQPPVTQTHADNTFTLRAIISNFDFMGNSRSVSVPFNPEAEPGSSGSPNSQWKKSSVISDATYQVFGAREFCRPVSPSGLPPTVLNLPFILPLP